MFSDWSDTGVRVSMQKKVRALAGHPRVKRGFGELQPPEIGHVLIEWCTPISRALAKLEQLTEAVCRSTYLRLASTSVVPVLESLSL